MKKMKRTIVFFTALLFLVLTSYSIDAKDSSIVTKSSGAYEAGTIIKMEYSWQNTGTTNLTNLKILQREALGLDDGATKIVDNSVMVNGVPISYVVGVPALWQPPHKSLQLDIGNVAKDETIIITYELEILTSLAIPTNHKLWGGITSNETSYLFGSTLINVLPTAIKYAIYYNANGGTGIEPARDNKVEGSIFNVINNPFTAPAGKKFKEWNTKANGTGTKYKEGASYTMQAANVTFYAIWENVSTPNGGSSTEKTPSDKDKITKTLNTTNKSIPKTGDSSLSTAIVSLITIIGLSGAYIKFNRV